MGVALCRRCANYSSSHLGVIETTENSRWLSISCFPCSQCPCHHPMPPVLSVTPIHFPVLTPKISSPYWEAGPTAISVYRWGDINTDCWMTCGPWSSSCCVFCHLGKQGLCFQSPWWYWLVCFFVDLGSTQQGTCWSWTLSSTHQCPDSHPLEPSFCVSDTPSSFSSFCLLLS